MRFYRGSVAWKTSNIAVEVRGVKYIYSFRLQEWIIRVIYAAIPQYGYRNAPNSTRIPKCKPNISVIHQMLHVNRSGVTVMQRNVILEYVAFWEASKYGKELK